MKKYTLLFTFSLLWLTAVVCQAQSGPSVQQAMSFKPSQTGVDYTRPTEEEAQSCKLEELSGEISGWKMIDKNGQVLRVFADTNGDKALDQWSYFKDGVEVYRDIDTDGNNKVNECRWFNMSGSRWGLDSDEDGRIDSWKRISPEEVAYEIFESVKTADKSRFVAVLLTEDDIASLDITDEQKSQLKELATKAISDFDEAKGKIASREAQFIQFNGDKPSAVPSLKGDGIVAFENVSSFVKDKNQEIQISNGTFIQIGGNWKATFCPQLQSDSEHAISSIFLPGGAASMAQANVGLSAQQQQDLISSMEKIDTQLAQTTDKEQKATLHKQRAAAVEKIAQAMSGDERAMWYRQLADGLSMGAQMGELPEGADILAKFVIRFKDENEINLAAYFSFRELMTRYYVGMAEPNADWAAIQMKYYAGLEDFIKTYPDSPDCAEALFQLAINQEMIGRESDATKCYDQIVTKFADTPQAVKSKGALFRLTSIGKQMQLRGVTTNNKQMDISKFKGYNVIVYYWNATSSSALSDVMALKAVKENYGSKLQIIGVNMDNNPATMNQFIESNKIGTWYQIDAKGPDGPLPNEMGIISPTMILVDKDGKIVNRNVQAKDLDSALKLLMPASPKAEK